MFVDNHLHLENRGNNDGRNFQDPADYIRKGRERGVKIFGFSDHAYIFNEAKDINFTPWQEERRKFDLEEYISILKRQKEAYPDVLFGLEIDYAPQKENQIRDFLGRIGQSFEFDFFIGSIHWIGNWGFDLDQKDYAERMKSDPGELYRKYFDIVRKAIQSQMFHILGHVDLIKIFSKDNIVEPHLEEILEILKKYDQTIEINTNGKNKPIGECYPSDDFVSKCYQNGISITLGSDAHSPDRTGESLDEAAQLLQKIGCKDLAYFEKGNKKKANITT